ncbi:MAG: replication-associated recombination protein A [Candidatus Omnitrophota bacterium]|nr:MAG: replication-associated recombination protein A [Candidatus Omnitrophota bacterium]
MEDSLFKKEREDLPLAVRMQPRTLGEFVGQEHILGEGKLLRRLIEADRISSLIFYGPPGTGKTALAQIIASTTSAHFLSINAISSNVEELRKVIQEAQQRKQIEGKRTILFIDEIHHFNKNQQYVLLSDIEKRNLILIGATIHNPFFSLISPLLSRSSIFEFKPLTEQEIALILERAINDKERGFGKLNLVVEEKAIRFLAKVCEGDARRALNALEIGVITTPLNPEGKICYDIKVAEESIQKKVVIYDRAEDGHYDTISAFIKSMRGSDPDATLYWLAKMLCAGEDVRFIARRIAICAAEDVGNADPNALVVANAALQISEFIGLPEARIPLAQAAVYIATAPKSNAVYKGIELAVQDIEKARVAQVPKHLRVSSYKGAERLGRGGYKYSHNYPGHFVRQEYLPLNKRYYQPTDLGYEKVIKQRLESLYPSESRMQR